MALVKNNLQKQLSTFIDADHPSFIAMPNNIAENANNWADALDLYTASISPPSTTQPVARITFLNIMNGLANPVEEDPTADPFTMYYISQESKMNRFNLYLRSVGYKANPLLDKTAVFTKLKNIRLAYNKQRPSIAFTDDDIYYNQARFNQIYANDIRLGTKLPLLADGVTVDKSKLKSLGFDERKYSVIPVDPTGVVIALDVDGIIGDDTIRYFPLVNLLVYEVNGSNSWNAKYKTLSFIHATAESGDMVTRIPFQEGSTSRSDWGIQKGVISNFKVRRNYIDKGLMKDYTKIRLDKVQFQYDGGQFTANDPTFNITVPQFVTLFSKNHSTCDPAWGATNSPTASAVKYTTLDSFLTAKRAAAKAYSLLPPTVTDGVTVLETAIKAYAIQLAIGMATGTPSYTGANVAPLSLKPAVSLGLSGSKSAQCVTMLSDLIHAYFLSGTATDNTTGLTIPWS